VKNYHLDLKISKPEGGSGTMSRVNDRAASSKSGVFEHGSWGGNMVTRVGGAGDVGASRMLPA